MNNINQNDTPRRKAVTFAAIDSYVETHMIAPTEKAVSNGDRYRWGDRDLYPGYLLELYDNCATLRSIIDGSVDYIVGDDVLFEGQRDRVLNKWGETAVDITRQVARNLKTFGGFALEIIRAIDGSIAEIYNIDLQNLRTNKDNTVFWYSEKWGKSNPEAEEIPAFMPEAVSVVRSILFVKMDQMRVYPSPPFAAAVKACEIERCIDDFHLNNLENGFTGSILVNIVGEPEDAEKEEVEKDFNEKFGGHQNAGRMAFSWNADKDSATTIDTLKVEDFGDRYDALAKRSRQAIFTAFRANPNLFGIPTDSLGFSSEEYESAFKLFNRTQVKPAQRMIADAFRRIYGAPVLQIIPFTLDGLDDQAVS